MIPLVVALALVLLAIGMAIGLRQLLIARRGRCATPRMNQTPTAPALVSEDSLTLQEFRLELFREWERARGLNEPSGGRVVVPPLQIVSERGCTVPRWSATRSLSEHSSPERTRHLRLGTVSTGGRQVDQQVSST